ncbi:MAG: NifB/NifX family molybdenum-iron cluster-binding protein [Planctomycetes bacterium]|nr:NifB/NifX family molybdenum-iron cluster-binding protein [Planctomycetota bacterium]
MKIAVPTVQGQLAAHFGHCEEFVLFDVDEESKTIGGSESLQSPPHQPGLLPRYLRENGADIIIAGGMGQRAQGLFTQGGVKVIVGAPAEEPRRIVQRYLSGELETGDNICDH